MNTHVLMLILEQLGINEEMVMRFSNIVAKIENCERILIEIEKRLVMADQNKRTTEILEDKDNG